MSIAEKLQTIAENEQKVFDAGYEKGKAEGGDTEAAYSQGFSDGEKSEHNRFWSNYQNNGNRISYRESFSGDGWNEETFKPKYNINPSDAYFMFRDSKIEMSLRNILEQQGVSMDFSNCTNFQFTFYNSKFTEVGVVDMRNAVYITSTFEYSSIITIEKIILKDDGSQNLSGVFNSMGHLENIIFEGVIGRSGVNFASSNRLTHDSLMSIINALKDYSGSTTTYSITLGATNLAKLTDTEKAIATQKGWTLA